MHIQSYKLKDLINTLIVMECRGVFRTQSKIYDMELFGKIVNGSKLLTLFPKRYNLDVRLGSEYASGDPCITKCLPFRNQNFKKSAGNCFIPSNRNGLTIK